MCFLLVNYKNSINDINVRGTFYAELQYAQVLIILRNSGCCVGIAYSGQNPIWRAVAAAGNNDNQRIRSIQSYVPLELHTVDAQG